MKKTTFYKIGALSLALLSAGVFTSFDDAMTDEQKVQAKLDTMVMEFETAQTELCKSQALAMAQAEWARMQQEMAAGDGTVPPSYTGGSRGDKPVTGGNSGSEEPTTSTGGNTGKDGQKINMNNTGDGGKMKMDNNNDDGTKSGGKMNMNNDSKSGGKMNMKKGG